MKAGASLLAVLLLLLLQQVKLVGAAALVWSGVARHVLVEVRHHARHAGNGLARHLGLARASQQVLARQVGSVGTRLTTAGGDPVARELHPAPGPHHHQSVLGGLGIAGGQGGGPGLDRGVGVHPTHPA